MKVTCVLNFDPVEHGIFRDASRWMGLADDILRSPDTSGKYFDWFCKALTRIFHAPGPWSLGNLVDSLSAWRRVKDVAGCRKLEAEKALADLPEGGERIANPRLAAQVVLESMETAEREIARLLDLLDRAVDLCIACENVLEVSRA